MLSVAVSSPDGPESGWSAVSHGGARTALPCVSHLCRSSMRTFVLRARAASTGSRKLLETIGPGTHAEIIAHTLMNAVFFARSHHEDVIVHDRPHSDVAEDFPKPGPTRCLETIARAEDVVCVPECGADPSASGSAALELALRSGDARSQASG